MAQEIVNAVNPEVPTKWVVEQYGTFRLGIYPHLFVDYAECVEVTDENGDPMNGAFGSIAYRHVHTGRRWRIILPSSDPDAFARMVNMNMVEIPTLIADGHDVDTANSMACENLELDRRAGNLTFATVEGNAP